MQNYRISVVIPTTGRRQALLRRAITSAFVDDHYLFIDLIVVVNGLEASEFSLPEGFLLPSNASIKVVRTSRANVSHARNLGIENATGEWLRFLDDDDFLVPDAAKIQYLELIETSCELSTYAGATQDENGHTFQIISPQASRGYACAVLGPKCPALTFASVYALKKVRGVRWNEDWSTTEDEDWMRRILLAKITRWITSDCVVGVWYQHSNIRLSNPMPNNTLYLNRASSIISAVTTLDQDRRLGKDEASAAAQGLWSAIHGGFYFSPIYWSRVAGVARSLDTTSRPNGRLFLALPWLHPLIIEWLFFPKRVLNHFCRLSKGWIAGFDFVRRIP